MDGDGPALATDAVIETPEGIVLIERANPPFKGAWALPGGFVEAGETVEAACRREAKEETGLDVELVDLLGVYSDPERDPRGHVVSVVIAARADGTPSGGSDAARAATFNLDDLPELAFDHARILADYRAWQGPPQGPS